MHLEILDKKRQEIFAKLSFLKKERMYLAGGTALALQLGHRTSIDFDFYSLEHFKKGKLFLFFKKHLKDHKIVVLRDFDDTFEINIDKKVHLSCFYYPYKVLSLFEYQGVKLASVSDIAAMKLVAVSQRGKRRDFYDMYYSINKFGLEKIIKFTQKKYPEFDIYTGLRGLIYFEDADKDKDILRMKLLEEEISWKRVKKYIEKEIKKFQSKF